MLGSKLAKHYRSKHSSPLLAFLYRDAFLSQISLHLYLLGECLGLALEVGFNLLDIKGSEYHCLRYVMLLESCYRC